MRTGFLLLAVLTAGTLCAAHPFRVFYRLIGISHCCRFPEQVFQNSPGQCK